MGSPALQPPLPSTLARGPRRPDWRWLAWLGLGGLSALAVLLVGLAFIRPPTDSGDWTERSFDDRRIAERYVDLTPVRERPRTFKPNTFLPNRREKYLLGVADPSRFSARQDLIRIEDAHVWWESDHQSHHDTEDDHLFHRHMRAPMLRLIALCRARDATLKVQDAYRPEGVHAEISLHKEGRAVDLTCDELPLEELAKLGWAAGFDWVYYEAPKQGGHHVHASVARD